MYLSFHDLVGISTKAMWLLVEMEYHILLDIFQVNVLTWLHLAKLVIDYKIDLLVKAYKK